MNKNAGLCTLRCIPLNMTNEMNLIDRFLVFNGQDLASPSCIHEGKVITRGAFLRAVCDFSEALHARGVQPGDVVGLSLGQHPGHLAMILALARLGAVSLPIHPNMAPRAKLAQLRRMNASRVIVQAKQPETSDDSVKRGPEGIEVIALSSLKPSQETGRPAHGMDLRGMLPYWPELSTPGRIGLTSGTTGQPNAVCYDHAYWVNRILTTIEHCDPSTRLMAGNLHLTMGNISAFAALFAGGVVVFHKPHDQQSYIDTVNLYGVTHAMMAPAMIKKMATRLPRGMAFPTLRYLRIVGGGLSAHLVALATSRLTPNVYLPYGISEVGAIAMATPDDLKKYPDYAGQPKSGVLVETVDANDQPLPPGEVGELRVKLPVMLPGYHLNEEKTKERFKNGWFYTNDMGTLTTDGYVRIDGRKDDRINLGGTKFYPDRVERLLDDHPDVAEVAVFASQLNGEPTLVAAVVWKDQPQVNALLAHGKEKKIPAGMLPKVVLSVPQLPRNDAGKVVRSQLAVLLQEQLSAAKQAQSEKPVLH
jgi:acyl-coenzyme A synthetase/AMP-(fatty) acid ligase